MKRAVLLACFCAAMALTPVVASASEVTGNIQKTYESVKAFTAKFSQVLTNAASGEKETRAGLIAFKKPALIRWETASPEKELLIVGRDAVWDYFEDDKEVFRYPVKEIINSKTMIRFLTGEADIARDFFVTAETRESPDAVKLTLVPRDPEPGLVEAVVWADAKTWLLTRISIRDFYANTNDLSLTDIKVNPQLPDGDFTFKPGPGVSVFDNAGAKGRDLP